MDIENPTNSREKELQIVIRSPLKVPDGWLVEQRSRPNRNPNHADIVDRVTLCSLSLNLIIHLCMHLFNAYSNLSYDHIMHAPYVRTCVTIVAFDCVFRPFLLINFKFNALAL